MLAARAHPGEDALQRGLLIGIAAFRWATWTWMAAILAIDARNNSLAHPWVGAALVFAALLFTGWATIEVRLRPTILGRAPVVATEVALAATIVFLDNWVYQSAHSQPLGSSWALAAILSAGVAFAGRGGLLAGAVIGAARFVGLQLWAVGEWNGDRWLAVWSSLFLYALAGGVAGFAAIKLREAERAISAARAREEVARRLHDGVLQTLAIVQRRSDDPALAELARQQELELREYLFGSDSGDGLAPALRRVGARWERQYRGRARVVVAEDLPKLSSDQIDALTGAVTEALNNAGKHGGADEVTVYVEPTDRNGVFCSIKDNGTGFEVAEIHRGIGLERSICGRLAELGGSAEIDGRPGLGAEIRLRLPVRG
jgi:signal transduction histidine kinase